ncbi:lantibiotic dehydratase [Streptomyces sp. QH1-20]|uniref:lantibiotic dehydratase n=1 Tax=Streptomyces sp. QH1-20 TaxID=3240934 RepID=UPI0035167FF4
MLRVAGLPIDSVAALRCPDSSRWADRVLHEEDRLLARGAELSDRLHPLVKDTPDDGDRRGLLALRRRLFNGRPPQDGDAAVALVTGADPGGTLAREVADWLRDGRRLAELHAAGGPLLAEEAARTRAALRHLIGEERLRRGLLLASPTLEGRLDAYAAHAPAAPPDKRLRKVERSALAYLYRTACKTSPFSTFTAVTPGELVTGGEEITLVPEEWHSHPRLNVVALARLAELIAADPGRRADLPVSLASGWELDDDRIRYVRRQVTTGDDQAAVTFDAAGDQLFFLRRSGTLERLLDLFAQRPAPRYGELVRRLSDDQGAGTEESEAYVAALLQLGMLHMPSLRTDVHSADPLRSFRDALRALDRPWADRLADALARPLACVDAYPTAGLARRRELLAELRDALRTIQRDLGGNHTPASPGLPQTLLYEDVTAGHADVTCVAQPYGAPGPLDALRDVERILPAFDLTLPQRITLKGFFVARYGSGGRCTDLLRLVHDFHEDFYEQYLTFTARRKPFDEDGTYVPEANWLALPGITALDRARTRWVEGMLGVWETARDAEEVRLDAGLLDAVATELAPVAPDFLPQSHFVQLVRRDGDPLAVLNQSYGGLAFPFSRFTHCYPEGGEGGLTDRLRRAAAATAPEGAVFAEITGGAVTSNLNLHGRLTDYEIVCPGETGSGPKDSHIHLDDLSVEHDAAADRLVLVSRRLGCEVVPVYLGYLVPLALPEIPRTLLLLSPTSMAPLDVWGGVPTGADVSRPGAVTHRPRVRYGGLVLSRRSWTTVAGALPQWSARVDEARWFVEWRRWRRAHGVPRRVFATVSRTGGARASSPAKPSYVDFDSYLSLTALDGLLKGDERDRVVFREALPDEDELHVASGAGRHVAELAVETLRTTRNGPDRAHRKEPVH